MFLDQIDQRFTDPTRELRQVVNISDREDRGIQGTSSYSQPTSVTISTCRHQ
jgi:hypothetical protein